MSLKDSLYHLIGHSSLHFLVRQMYVVYSANQVLLDFFGDVLDDNWDQALEKREKIKEFTQQARNMLQNSGTELANDLFAPVVRAEVISLLQLQTQIANKAQAITGLVVGRRLSLPPSVGVEFFPMLNKCIAAVYQTYNLINHLQDLAAAHSKSHFLDHLNTMIVELDKLENETDQLQIQARNAVYALEVNLYPVDVMSLYKMLEWTGDLADRAHELGGKLISLLAK